MQRMKQLARSAVYWPHINEDIEQIARLCHSCAEDQNRPPKPTNHPWMLPKKPWGRLHGDHAINFLGTNWFVLIDAYSKYLCIHPTGSISARATTDLLEQDFSHFGYPHTLVTDNVPIFHSEEFQAWSRERITTSMHRYTVGAPCYARYCGPRHNKEPRWTPAVVVKVLRTWSIKVGVLP
ncbi:hypothetical protein J437_LFUL016540 [Ladona fulva]|uniref:RNA-directed DNA polymerase n=1 Tax=Ladona fulva TaxID=123851 RepID=A0A8K0KMG5_LADFU|nr:hypothetical protein J437_LFUL016540 [Ladona fulva]